MPRLGLKATPRQTVCVLVVGAVIVTLFACGVTVVREYVLGREFELTSCRVQSVSYLPQNIECRKCKKQKKSNNCWTSTYPCLRIAVNYTDRAMGEVKEGLIHYGAMQLTEDSLCAVSVCEADPDLNQVKVEKYARQWRHLNQTEDVTCYYSRVRSGVLIAQKHFNKWDVFHSMFWPSLVLGVFFVAFVCLVLCRTCNPTDKRADTELPQ